MERHCSSQTAALEVVYESTAKLTKLLFFWFCHSISKSVNDYRSWLVTPFSVNFVTCIVHEFFVVTIYF